MGETAAIAMGMTGATPSSLKLLELPPEVWKVFADGMLERALACYSDGQIDCATALHWVMASSQGCSDDDRLRVLDDAAMKLPNIKPRPLIKPRSLSKPSSRPHRKPLYPEPLKKAIAEVVSVLASNKFKVTRTSKNADMPNSKSDLLALPIVRSWIEQSGLLRKGQRVPSEKSLYNWYLKYPYTPPVGAQK